MLTTCHAAGWSSPLLLDASQGSSPLRLLLPDARVSGNCVPIEVVSTSDGLPQLFIFTCQDVRPQELLVLGTVPPQQPARSQVRCSLAGCCASPADSA